MSESFQHVLHVYQTANTPEHAQAITAALQEQLCSPSAQSKHVLQTLIPLLQSLNKDEPLAELLAFDLFPYISPLVAVAAYRDVARQALSAIVDSASSPRELFLALCERLSGLPEDEDEDDEEVQKEVHEEIVTLISLAGAVLERINSKKPAAFMLDFRSRLLPTLKALSFSRTEQQAILSALYTFTTTTQMRASSLSDEEQLKTVSALSCVLLAALGVLNPGAGLSAAWFKHKFPKLAHPNLQTLQVEEEFKSEMFWPDAKTAAINLQWTPEKLLQHALAVSAAAEVADQEEEAPKPTPIDLSTKLGAFILLCHLSQDGSFDPTYFQSVERLDQTFGLILAYLNHQSKACDEALVWLFSFVESFMQGNKRKAIDETRLFLLVERLREVSAFSSDASIRLVAFKLLSRLIKDYCSAQEDLQLIMLKELLFEAPSESLKSAAVGLLREVLALKFGTAKSSIFKTPLLLEEYLQPLLRTFDFPAGALNECPSTLLVQCLNLYYFILCSDAEDQTGLRNPSNRESVKLSLFEPLRAQVQVWREEPAQAEDITSLGDLPAIEMVLDRILEKNETLSGAS